MNRKTIFLLGVLFTLIYLWESIIVKDQTINSPGLFTMCIGATNCSGSLNNFTAYNMSIHFLYTLVPFQVGLTTFERIMDAVITGLAVTILMLLAYGFTARTNVIIASGVLFALSQAVFYVIRKGGPEFLGLIYFLIVMVYVYKIMHKNKTLDQDIRDYRMNPENIHDNYSSSGPTLDDTTKSYILLGIACSGFVFVNFQFVLFAAVLPLLAITLDTVEEKFFLYITSYTSYILSMLTLFLLVLPIIEGYPVFGPGLLNTYISAHIPLIPVTIDIQTVGNTLTDLVKLVFAVNYFSLGITFFRTNFPLVMLSVVFLLLPFIKLLYLQQGMYMRKFFLLLVVAEIIFIGYNLFYAVHDPGDWVPLIGVLAFHNAILVDNPNGLLYETLQHAIQRRPILYVVIGFLGELLLNIFPDAYFAVLILNAFILFFGMIYLVSPEFLMKNQYTAWYSQLIFFLFGVYIYLWVAYVY